MKIHVVFVQFAMVSSVALNFDVNIVKIGPLNNGRECCLILISQLSILKERRGNLNLSLLLLLSLIFPNPHTIPLIVTELSSKLGQVVVISLLLVCIM